MCVTVYKFTIFLVSVMFCHTMGTFLVFCTMTPPDSLCCYEIARIDQVAT